MSFLKERVSYLKGLAEGMQLDVSTNEGKLLKAIIEVMDDMALAVDDIEEVQEQLSEQVEDINDDLAEVEKAVFDEDDEHCCCEDEIECPYCNEKITLDENLIADDGSTLKCPSCGKEIEIDWDCECEDCSEHEK
ncbi:zinc ribbon protein [Anaerobacterium chartisolvens]|uniref:Zinc ribbon protein n=1 Tax=Anaerobacterium chartisolvens TaxID=1297424 RepID=A0A369APC8_9FIRM|nr:CD1247 N-terminal domain-containing protein [Anaerobacterium chartisolvens]RCX09304.1 zinc ribbon protein [Anaerobacterium chartisolvens]